VLNTDICRKLVAVLMNLVVLKKAESCLIAKREEIHHWPETVSIIITELKVGNGSLAVGMAMSVWPTMVLEEARKNVKAYWLNVDDEYLVGTRGVECRLQKSASHKFKESNQTLDRDSKSESA
jgi:hypothetical protein